MKRGVTLAVTALALVAVGVALAAQNWSVGLTGDQEIPPRDTKAHGQASFHLNKTGDELRFKLNVANIENVVQAHIHCGTPTDNGPIAVWLYPNTTGGPALSTANGRIQGRIADGVLTDANVIDLADSAACPGGVDELEDVIAKINGGGAYVNVHTNDFVGAINTGPGDFPMGEIRGNLP